MSSIVTSTVASYKGGWRHDGAKKWWRRPATCLAVIALALSGSLLEQVVSAPSAAAESVQGSLDTGGWKYPIAGTGANAAPTPIRLGTTTSSSSPAVPFPVNDGILYFSDETTVGTFATDHIPPTTAAGQTLIGHGGGGGGVNPSSLGQLSTIAIDADPYGVRGHRYAYMWAWNSNNTVSTAQNGGVKVPSDTLPVMRWEDGSTDGEFLLVPDVTYFPSQGGYRYWSGGEVNQFTGEIYFGGAECDTINRTYNMMIYNPYTYEYNFSGQILPSTPADNIFGNTATTCSGQGYTASDMALDANGNAYLLVNSTTAVPSWGVGTGTTTWMVRVVPGKSGQPWTYSLVMPLKAAPGQANATNNFLSNGSIFGMGFFEGMLYAATNTRLFEINPMSGLVYNLPHGSATPPTVGPVESTVLDLASGQGAMVIEGTVYNDIAGDGVLNGADAVLPDQTVALYMEDPNNPGSWIYEGSRKTNGSGQYSFLVGGYGNYAVRLVSPTVDNAMAWQTYATGGGNRNPVVAVCSNGNITSGSGKCFGAKPYPYSDPALPGDNTVGTDTSTPLSAMAMYSTIKIVTDEEVASADFGVTKLPNIPASTLSLDKDSTKVGTAITATVSVVDMANQPIAGKPVSFAVKSGDVTLSSPTCITGDGTGGTVAGKCSVTLSSKVADTYEDELSATLDISGTPTPVTGSPKTVTFTPGVPTVGPFECKAGQESTNLKVAPTTVAVGGAGDVTVLVTDQYCNPIPGVTVNLGQVISGTTSPSTTAKFEAISGTPAGTTGDDGKVTAQVGDTAQEVIGVSASIDAGLVPNSPVAVTFELGEIDYDLSTFAVTPVANVADQATWVTVGGSYTGTLLAKDSHGNNLPGLNTGAMDFTSSSGDVTVSNVVNNHDGTYTVTFTSTKADPTPTAALKYEGVQVGSTKPIPFKVGDPQDGPWACESGTVPGTGVYTDSGSSSIDNTVGVWGLVTDKYCNPIPGVPVSLTVDSTTAALKPVSGAAATSIAGTTGVDGKVTGTLADTKPETVKITGEMSVHASPKPMGSASVLFMAGTPVPGPYSCDGGTVPGTGVYSDALSSSVDGKVGVWGLVTDAQCNPLPGIPVGLAVTGGVATLSDISGLVTGADGKVSAKLGDTVPELVTVSGTMTNPYDPSAPADKLMGSISVLFTAGAPVEGPYSCEAGTVPGTGVYSSAATASVDNSVDVWGLVTDQYCNPLPGYSVTLVADSPTASLKAGATAPAQSISGITGTDGKVVAALVDTKPETVKVTGSFVDTVSKPMGSTSVVFTAGDPVPGPWSCADPANPGQFLPGTGVYADPQFTSVDHTSLITGLVTDQYCTPLPNVPVALAVISGHGTLGTQSAAVTNASGKVTATLSDTVPEQVVAAGTMTNVFDANAPASKQMGQVVVTFSFGDPYPGPWSCVDPNNPGQTIRGTGVYADTLSSPVDATVGITALVTDIECNPIPGVPVTLALSGSAGSTAYLSNISGSVTDADGQVTAVLGDRIPETVKVTGTMSVNSVGMPMGSADVTFTNGAPVVGPYSCEDPERPGHMLPGTGVYSQASTATVDETVGVWGLVTDQYCNPLPGISVTLTTDSPTAKLGSGLSVTGTTGLDGKVSAQLGDIKPESVKVTGSFADGGPKPMGNTTVVFTAGDPVPGPWSCDDPNNPGQSILGTSVTANSPVGIAGWSDVTALVTDKYCNAVAGVAVNLTVAGSTTATLSLNGSNITGADGIVSAKLTDTKPETVTVNGTMAIGIVGNADVVFVTAGAPHITSPTSGTSSNNNRPLISGDAGEPGQSVTVEADNGATHLTVCTAIVKADGTWQCQADVDLPDGVNTLVATQTDSLGRSGPSNQVVLNIKTSLPPTPEITSPTDGAITNNPQPVFSGTGGEPGSTVTVKDDTGKVICEVVIPAASLGGWSCTPTQPLPDGEYSFTAEQTNDVGTTGDPSESVHVKIKATPPVAPSITSPTDGAITNDNTPTVSGTGAEPGATVTVKDGNGNVLCTTTVPITSTDGVWSCQLDNQLPDGDQTITAQQTDVAGNTGPNSPPIHLHVKTTPPNPPEVDSTNGSQITGSSDPGTTITVTDDDGNPVPGCESVKTDSSGRFSCRPTKPLQPGSVITVTAVDEAGNQSEPVTVEIVALAIVIANPVVRVGDSQTVTGYHFNPGERVHLGLFSDALDGGYAIANADGTVAFVFAVPGLLAPGTHTAVLTGAQSGAVSGTFDVVGTNAQTGGAVASSLSLGLGISALVLLLGAGLVWALVRRKENRRLSD